MDLMAIRRSLMIGQKPTGRLPRGFREVEYLESTGTQYIANVIAGNLPKSWMEVEFMVMAGSPGNTQFIGTTLDNKNAVPKIAFESVINLRQDHNISLLRRVSDTRIKISTDAMNKVYVNDSYVTTINDITTAQSGYNLFSVHPNMMKYASKARLYYFRLISSNGNVIDLVPCVSKSDNKPGMYDLCGSICPLTNSPFYINGGTGEFIPGPEIYYWEDAA
ncbi:MAG: hypothetical protein IKH57_21210 [Clostridia bacterium]|nr:hypothetical protein [Clostridia bacterium]